MLVRLRLRAGKSQVAFDWEIRIYKIARNSAVFLIKNQKFKSKVVSLILRRFSRSY